MTVFQCDRTLHAMNEKQASSKEVIPGSWQRRQDEELPEVVLGVVGHAPRNGPDLYAFLERGGDPNEQKLDATGRRVRLLSDAASYAFMVSASLARPDRSLNLLPGSRVDACHGFGLVLIRLTMSMLTDIVRTDGLQANTGFFLLFNHLSTLPFASRQCVIQTSIISL